MAGNAIRFSIAGVVFQVKADNKNSIEWLKKWCAQYILTAEKAPDVKIRLYYNKSDSPRLKDRLLSRRRYNIYGKLFQERPEFRIYARREYIAMGDILRFLTGTVLIRKGGCLLHSCGVIIDEGAYLLAGPSGSGKTTIARLLNDPSHLLSDETTAITKKGGKYYAWATPFFGDFGRNTSNKRAAIKSILFLKKSDRFSHRRIKSSLQAANLLKNILLFENRGQSWYNLNNLLDIALDIVHKIPSYEFEFIPHNNIWRYIKEKISRGAL